MRWALENRSVNVGLQFAWLSDDASKQAVARTEVVAIVM